MGESEWAATLDTSLRTKNMPDPGRADFRALIPKGILEIFYVRLRGCRAVRIRWLFAADEDPT